MVRQALKSVLNTTVLVGNLASRLCLQFLMALLRAKPEVMVVDAISIVVTLLLCLWGWLDLVMSTTNLMFAKLSGQCSDDYRQRFSSHFMEMERKAARFKPVIPTWRRVWECPTMKGYF